MLILYTLMLQHVYKMQEKDTSGRETDLEVIGRRNDAGLWCAHTLACCFAAHLGCLGDLIFNCRLPEGGEAMFIFAEGAEFGKQDGR